MLIEEIIELSKMNIKELSEYLHIPYRTLQDWKLGNRKCPEYILELIEYKLRKEKKLNIDK